MKLALLLILLLILIPRSVIASARDQIRHNQINNYELRLSNIAQKLDRLDSPIQQMGPRVSIAFDSGYEDVQSSFDEVNERLSMIKFVIDHEKSAPQDKKELAYSELKFISSDIQDLEEQTLGLSKSVSSYTWY